ncbi:MAG: protein kinase [Polyangiaceae bacterium]
MAEEDFCDELDSELFDDFIERVAATELAPQRSARVRPGDVLANRFEVRRQLGAGGMGQVFAAWDREQSYEVALKVLRAVTPRSLERLKREFRAACELVHPNLVRLHQLFADDTQLFFTMDLVEGNTLPELLKQQTESRMPVLREIFSQLAVAIDALHRAGTLHRDLKPSNFLISALERRVVLLDFGLAHPIGESGREPAGTPAYMAPEQRLNEPLTEATDWYAFGVVLYEALSGKLPQPLPSHEQLAGVPADLRDLCVQLLSLRAADRPRAPHVLRVVGATPRETFSLAPTGQRPIVGRAREFAQLRAAYQSTHSGQPAFVLIDGPSGIGKTALMEHFVASLTGERCVLLSSRCRERESMSYKAVDGLIDCLVSELDALADEDADALLPDGIEQLTVLFPALRAARVIAQLASKNFDHVEQTTVRDQGVAAFVELVGNLRARGPLIIWVDDLHWSDAESALLLGPLLSGAHAVPVLFVGSQRSRLGQDGALVSALGDAGALPASRQLSLTSLAAEHAEQLAFSVLEGRAQDARELARTIARDAGGHPLFIAELAYGAASRGADWQSAPSTLFELVETRVAALDSDARALLELSAIAGTPLSRAELRRALGVDRRLVANALDALKALRLVRTQGLLDDETAVDIQHDRIREIIVDRLDDRQSRHCHARLAAALEASPDALPERIALHLQFAGDLGRASNFFLAAAERASKALAFARAATLYAQGLEHAQGEPHKILALQVRRAEALAHAGRGIAAADVYLSIADKAPPVERTELQRRGAEQLLLSAELERGLQVIQDVLRQIDMRPLRRGIRALLSIAVGRAQVRARGLAYRVQDEARVDAAELARLDASWTISCSLSLIDPVCGADFQNEHLLLALRAGEPRRLLRALTLEASYAATPGRGAEQRTEALLSVAQTLVQESTDAAALGLLNLARGLVEYLLGRTANSLPLFREALQCFQERCAGAVWETMSAQRFVIASLFFLGRLRELGEIVPQILAQSEGRTTRYTTVCFCSAYSTVAWLARDDCAEAERQLDLARAHCTSFDFRLPHFNLLVGETYLDLYREEPQAALERITSLWPAIERSQLLRVGVLRVQLWHLRGTAAALSAAVAAERGDQRECRHLRREALSAARRLSSELIPRAAPLGAMIAAAIASATGDLEHARERLSYAMHEFAAQDMSLFEAAARIRLGTLSDGEPGRALLRGGLARFQQERVRSAARLVNVFAPGFNSHRQSLISEALAVRAAAGFASEAKLAVAEPVP